MDTDLLPKTLYLSYLSDVKESGKVHSPIAALWEQGDEKVRNAMKKFASLAEEAKGALETKNYSLLYELMDKNFNLRREIYGDNVIGKNNLQMIQMFRDLGGHSKFQGSGGAIVGYCPPEKVDQLVKEMDKFGYKIVALKLN